MNVTMILSFKHEGLAWLHRRKEDRARGPSGPWFGAKGARILARLDIAREPNHMDLPGWSLQPLKGPVAGLWSVWVTGNWWIVFRFEDKNVVDVDLIEFSKLRRKLWRAYKEPPTPRTVGAT